MRTKLAIIAVSGFAISAACLGGAFALGGNAIGNAVFDATGVRLRRVPFTPERVKLALAKGPEKMVKASL